LLGIIGDVFFEIVLKKGGLHEEKARSELVDYMENKSLVKSEHICLDGINYFPVAE